MAHHLETRVFHRLSSPPCLRDIRITRSRCSPPYLTPIRVDDVPSVSWHIRFIRHYSRLSLQESRWRQTRSIQLTACRLQNQAPKESPRNEETSKDGVPSKARLIDSTRALGQKMKERVSGLTPAHENIYTIPNVLTVSRLIATPVIGYLVLHDNYLWATGLFFYAGVSDLIDGWMARKYNLQTVVGSVIDPMADKALMTVLVGCLAIKGALPLWLATVILGRDMSLGIAAFYYRYASLPAPKTFMRYWDFSIPSAEVHPTAISKANTFLQLALIGSTLVTPLAISSAVAAPETIEGSMQAFQYLVAATTLWSGASYLWTKDAVVILGRDEVLKKKQGFRGRAVLGVSFAAFLGLALYLDRRQAEHVKEKRADNPDGDAKDVL